MPLSEDEIKLTLAGKIFNSKLVITKQYKNNNIITNICNERFDSRVSENLFFVWGQSLTSKIKQFFHKVFFYPSFINSFCNILNSFLNSFLHQILVM